MSSKAAIIAGSLIILIAVGGTAFYFFHAASNEGQEEGQRGVFNGTAATAAVITIDAQGFHPDTAVIKQGESVRWKNTDASPHWPASNLHPTHEIYPEFDPEQGIPPGQDWSFVFTKKGKWFFHDHLNPLWQGSITVE